MNTHKLELRAHKLDVTLRGKLDFSQGIHSGHKSSEDECKVWHTSALRMFDHHFNLVFPFHPSTETNHRRERYCVAQGCVSFPIKKHLLSKNGIGYATYVWIHKMTQNSITYGHLLLQIDNMVALALATRVMVNVKQYIGSNRVVPTPVDLGHIEHYIMRSEDGDSTVLEQEMNCIKQMLDFMPSTDASNFHQMHRFEMSAQCCRKVVIGPQHYILDHVDHAAFVEIARAVIHRPLFESVREQGFMETVIIRYFSPGYVGKDAGDVECFLHDNDVFLFQGEALCARARFRFDDLRSREWVPSPL